jgi:hypothetical protein
MLHTGIHQDPAVLYLASDEHQVRGHLEIEEPCGEHCILR